MATGLNLTNTQLSRGVGLGLAGGGVEPLAPTSAGVDLSGISPFSIGASPAPIQPSAPVAPTPDPSQSNIFSDLGFLLSSVSAGMRGTPLPESPAAKRAAAQAKARKFQLEQDKFAQEQFAAKIKNLETFTKLAKDTPAAGRAKLKEVMLASFGDSPLAGVMDIAFEDDSIMEIAASLGIDPEHPTVRMLDRSDVKIPDKLSALRDLADDELLPKAMSKLSRIMANPEAAFPPDILERVQADAKVTPAEIQAFNDSILDEGLKLSKGELTTALRNEVFKLDDSESRSLKHPAPGDITFADGSVLPNTVKYVQGDREVYRDPQTGTTVPIPPGAKFNPRLPVGQTVNLVAQSEFMKRISGGAADRITAKLTAAEGSRGVLTNISSARNALDRGAIVGLGSNFREGFGRLLAASGLQFAKDSVANTEAFAAIMGKQVLDMVKTGAVGTGQSVTDNDILFLKNVVGANPTLTEDGIRNILRISENAAKEAMESYRQERLGLAVSNPDALNFLPEIRPPGAGVRFGADDETDKAKTKRVPKEKPIRAATFDETTPEDEIDAELRRRGIDPLTLEPLEP